MKDAADSKRRLDESDRARIRLEAEVSAGLIEGAKLTEELVAAQVCAHTCGYRMRLLRGNAYVWDTN